MIGRRDDAALAQLQRRDVGCLLIDTRAESGNGGCWIGLKEETERGGRRGTRGMTDLKQKKYIYVGMTFFFFFFFAMLLRARRAPWKSSTLLPSVVKERVLWGLGGIFRLFAEYHMYKTSYTCFCVKKAGWRTKMRETGLN